MEMNEERVKVVLKKMREMGLKQIILTDPTSLFYLTGHFEEPIERFWALYLTETGNHRLVANRLFTLPEVEGVEILWYADGESAVEKLLPLDRKSVV